MWMELLDLWIAQLKGEKERREGKAGTIGGLAAES